MQIVRRAMLLLVPFVVSPVLAGAEEQNLPLLARFWASLLACLALGIGLLFLAAPRAEALPSFAAQTGQPCTACHIGGFGPQLTPLGTAFKIGGYTQRVTIAGPTGGSRTAGLRLSLAGGAA